jgi:hypothetical protein
MITLLNELENYCLALKSGCDDKTIIDKLIKLVYGFYQENTFPLFLAIQKLERDKMKEEVAIMYGGLEDSMNNFVSMARPLLEDKNNRAKLMAKEIMFSDNLAYLIRICKAYFPDGKPHTAAQNGRWMLDAFVQILKENKSKYIIGGSSYDWAKNFGYVDYINLIIKEYNL